MNGNLMQLTGCFNGIALRALLMDGILTLEGS